MSQPSLLIVDDEAGVRESIRLIFNKDFRLLEAKSSAEATQRVQEEKPEIILLDILMPGANGLDTLKKIKSIHPAAQVIMLTALNTARTAFTAKESGAFDYVTKPFDVDELRLRVSRALEKTQLSRELERLRAEVGSKYGIENIVGKSKPMLDIYKVGSFVVVNCAALPDTLIESELFGYERGAFTNAHQRKIGHFESAHGGTLFLDEIGELELGSQAKFLRAVETETFTRLGGTEEIKVDVRVVAASNQDLEKLAGAGEFRRDLFYRLNVVSLRLPPLRERGEDIPLLLDHFLRLKAQENSTSPKTLSAEVVECMMSYPWPGNVRELENLVERLTILSPHESVVLADLPPRIRFRDQTSSLKEKVLEGSHPLSEAVDEFERELILKALQKSGFNQTKAASVLGTSRRVLRYRMEKLQISESDAGPEQTKLSG